MIEAEFIAALRRLPLHPGALGLADDAARLGGYILTTDTMVEGVHFLATDPPEDVAWKLVATNLSDPAAKGARPEGALLNYPLGEDKWDRAFLAGLDTALAALDCPLIGGDTVSLPPGAPRVLTLTAIGADAVAPARSGALPGDDLWVTGTIGDAGAGLALLQTGVAGPQGLIERYRTPRPRLEAGLLLAPLVSAMMDVSDGLLIDAKRMAMASECALALALDAVPLSDDFLALRGADRDARLDAVAAGDDYELLFAAPPGMAVRLLALAEEIGLPLTRIGRFVHGAGLTLTDGDEELPLPARLGFEHGA